MTFLEIESARPGFETGSLIEKIRTKRKRRMRSASAEMATGRRRTGSPQCCASPLAFQPLAACGAAAWIFQRPLVAFPLEDPEGPARSEARRYKWWCKGCFTEFFCDLDDHKCTRCGTAICISEPILRSGLPLQAPKCKECARELQLVQRSKNI